MTEITASESVKNNDLVIEDRRLESLLDSVDERTHVQQVLHDHISNGFMSLARERYRDPASVERLGRLVYDDREEVSSKLLIDVRRGDIVAMSRCDEASESAAVTGSSGSSTMRRRNVGGKEGGTGTFAERRKMAHTDVRNSFMAIPSSEVREAMRCFRMAVDQAIELANTNSRLKAELSEYS